MLRFAQSGAHVKAARILSVETVAAIRRDFVTFRDAVILDADSGASSAGMQQILPAHIANGRQSDHILKALEVLQYLEERQYETSRVRHRCTPCITMSV
jgi:hypothetical protein